MRLVTLGLGAGATASHLLLFGLIPGDAAELTAHADWRYSVAPDDLTYSVTADDLTYRIER